MVEVGFTGELYYSKGNKVFFPNVLLFGIFFVTFMIIYFQLYLSKRSIGISVPNHGYHGIAILEIFTIYSIYSLVLFFIGGYESQLREAYSLKSDPFSLYTFKIATYPDIINFIPPGVIIILLSTLTSFLFSAWMVQYVMTKEQNRYLLVESLRSLARGSVIKDTLTKMLLLFIVTLVASIIDFVLTNIAVTHNSDALQMYLYQFVILSVVESLFAPFFLVCLFLIILSRSFSSRDI
ncbi:MAG TPA: hypothetical protein VFI73_14150 [Candidatus Nitrosopolaris sp.]|nr:hypothetical protein [Candidatus Nitrosopolaris sp.]